MATDSRGATPDPLYDLVGTLYHALKQASAARRHAEDARGGDPELTAFFEDVHEQSLDLAARCKTLLATRMGEGRRTEQEKVQQASEESFPASDAPAY